MREPIENINNLQRQINELQLENQLLKNLLDHAGISYIHEIKRLNAAEEVCDGNMNLLAKIQTEDSMMHIESKKIAAELMEITFGE